MKTLLFFSFLFTCHFSYCQSTSTPYFFNEVGLFINVPSKFRVLTAEENERIRKKGEKVIEEANNIDINASSTTSLISVKEGQFNYLDVTITPKKNYTAQGYAADNELVKEALYKTFLDRMPAENIDTASMTIKIDGLRFDAYQMKFKLTPTITMRMVLLSKYYKGYDLGMCYVYIDEAIGKELEAIVEGVTFKK